MADSNKLLAQRAATQGVCVRWEQYAEMPHIFMLMLGKLPQSALSFQNWAHFCLQCVDKSEKRPQSSGAWFKAETLEKLKVDPEHLTDLSLEEALSMMREERAKRKVWTGPTRNKKAAL